MEPQLIGPTLAQFLAIAIFLGAVIKAHAGNHGCMVFSGDIFGKDTNIDGVFSFEEYSALHSEKPRWGFKALDTDNDGSNSLSDWETFLKVHSVGKGSLIL